MRLSVDACAAAIPLALAAWSVSSSTLHHLDLRVSVENLPDIIPPTLVFPHLSHLTVELRIVYRSSDAMAHILGTLLPFLNRSSPTLTSFALLTREHLPLKELYTKLSVMPKLRSFVAMQGYVSTLQTDTSGLHDFLSRHSDALHSLSLSFYSLGSGIILDPEMEGWTEQEFLRVSLPNLTSLTLGLYDFPAHFGEKIRKSLQGLSIPELRHLYLPMPLPLLELEEIFQDGMDIQVLTLNCTSIEAALFDLVASKLPRLLHLDLRYAAGRDNHAQQSQEDQMRLETLIKQHVSDIQGTCTEALTLTAFHNQDQLAPSDTPKHPLRTIYLGIKSPKKANIEALRAQLTIGWFPSLQVLAGEEAALL